MKRLLIGLGIGLVVVLIALVAVPFLVPAERYKGALVRAVERATGRDVRVDGPVSLSLLPRLSLAAEGVVVRGAAGRDLARVGSLDLEVALRPLLDGRVEVERFILREPTLWIHAEGMEPKGTKPEGAGRPQDGSGEGGGPLATGPDIRLGPVQVVDGTVVWTDAGDRTVHEFKDVDATLTLPDLAGPARLEGGVGYRGRRIHVQATVAQPRQLAEGVASDLAVTLASNMARASFHGQVQAGQGQGQAGEPRAAGRLEAAAPDLRALVAWLAAEPSQAAGLPFTNASLKAAVVATPASVGLRDAELALDDMTARGQVAVALAPARPKVEGRLALSRLDLDRFMPARTVHSDTAGAAGPQAPDQKAGSPQAGSPAGKKDGWSRDPIDLSGLKTLDADLHLDLAGLTVRRVDVGATTLALRLAKGRLEATLGEAAVLGGTVSGRLTTDAGAKVPAWGLETRMAGVQAEPLLERLAGFQRLTGSTRAEARLTTRGASPQAMVAGLDGEGQVALTNGAITGVDLAAMVRNVTTAFQSIGAGERTEFTELAASFRATDGTVTTDDLRFQSPVVRVRGDGRVLLPQREVAFRLEPTVAVASPGQGGRDAEKGLAVPVLVGGTFDHLTFAPDLAGLATEALRNPDALKGRVETLKGMLSGDRPSPTDGATHDGGTKPMDRARDLLDGLTKGAQPNSPADALKGLLGQ